MKITYSKNELFPRMVGCISNRKRSILLPSGRYCKINLLHRLLVHLGYHEMRCKGCGSEAIEIEEHPIFNRRNKHVKSYISFNTENDSILTVDHIVPRSIGGSNNFANLQVMCRCCNSVKDDKIICEYEKIYSICDIHYHIRGKYPNHHNITDLMSHHADIMAKTWVTGDHILTENEAIGYLSFLTELFEFDVDISELKFELIPKDDL